MWYLDVGPELDPDENYRPPTQKQYRYADAADCAVGELKALLEKLTIPQQRKILNKIGDELVGGVYRYAPAHIKPK
jgi:hypothetical protein